MTHDALSRPPYPHFMISSSVRGMAPPLLIIIAILALIVVAMTSAASPSTRVVLAAQPLQPAQVVQLPKPQSASQQLPFQAVFAPASGQPATQPMSVLYQSSDPTNTPTPGPGNPLATFTPDPNAPQIFITSQDARFFPNPTESVCKFNVTTATPPAFTEPKKFPVVNFNPELDPAGCNPPIPSPDTRPFTDLVPNSGASGCATQVAADHLNATPTLQAGVTPGALYNFHAVYTGQIYVPAAGDVTLNFYVDDAWVLGIGPKIGGPGEQPYYVSGVFDPAPPPSPTPSPITVFNGYLVVSRLQHASDVGLRPTTIHFTSAGFYPIELDYTECNGQRLEMVLGSAAAVPIPNGSTPTATAVPTSTCTASSDWCTGISANDIGHNDLRAVAVIAQDDIWAVGGYDIDMSTNTGHSLVEFWNNSTWAEVSVPNVGILNGIVAVGNNYDDIYAIGDTRMLRFHGGTWSLVTGRHGGNGIAAGAGLIVAVGNAMQDLQWNDGTWHDQPNPSDTSFNAVTVIASNEVLAVGYTGMGFPDRRASMEKWNGSTWTAVTGPSFSTDSYLTGIDLYDASHLWAVGAYYDVSTVRHETLVEYGDGSGSTRTWSIIDSPNPSSIDNELHHVWVTTEGDVWAVGSSGNDSSPGNTNTFIMRWNDTNWAQIIAPAPGVSSELWGVATIPGNTAVVTSTWAIGGYKAYGYSPSQTLVENIQAIQAPHTTVSYYENALSQSTLSKYYTQGCTAAANGDLGVIVLDFGQPLNLGSSVSPNYGTLLTGPNPQVQAYITDPNPTPTGTPSSPVDITHAVEEFAFGYHDAYYSPVPVPNCPHVSGTVYSIVLSVGVNNQLNGVVLPTPTVEISGHAQAWAAMLGQIKADLAGYSEITIRGAIDAEPSYDMNYQNTLQWAEAYNAATNIFYYDFGSTDSYPTLPTGTPTPVVPPFVCCSPWTVDRIYHVSQGIDDALALPEIYTPQYAREWNRVKRWSIESGLLHLEFEGEMSECKTSPCRSNGITRYFNQEEGWRVFWMEINGDPDTRQTLTYSTDIRCSNGYTQNGCATP